MSFRRSVPKGQNSAVPTEKRVNYRIKVLDSKFPSIEKEKMFLETVIRRIYDNFPNTSTDMLNRMHINGLKVVMNLSKKHGFQRVKDVLNWGLKDFFWKKQIRSVSPLEKISKNDPDRTKFEVIADCYDRAVNGYKFDLNEELESLAAYHYESEADRRLFVDDAEWFIEKVEKINAKGSKQLSWTTTPKVLKVLEGFIALEKDIVDDYRYPTWGELINEYIKYLTTKVLVNDTNLYPGHFDRYKPAFKTFIHYAEKKHDTSILEY